MAIRKTHVEVVNEANPDDCRHEHWQGWRLCDPRLLLNEQLPIRVAVAAEQARGWHHVNGWRTDHLGGGN